MSSIPDVLIAALADRYRIERELGAGGMATVYLARDLKHDRQVAIKVLRSELGASLGTDRFLQEIRVAAKLQHPHIVGLLDSGTFSDGEGGAPLHPYYVMPYVEGETLRDRLTRTGPLGIAEATRLTGEIADALAKAHKAGIVHRDIKPENILIADGHAMVMDFGVAKAVSDATGRQGLTSAGISIGTPAYMAPEQVAADPLIDHRADLYSLGLVAYEMLAGGSPYAATTPQQQMAAHLAQPPAPLQLKRPDCPPALAALIMRCLAKNPDDRPQSAGEMLTVLGTAPIPLATAPVNGAARRWRWPFAAAAVVALAAVVVVMTRRRVPPSAVAEGADLIAVMPLSAVSDTSLVRLGRDLVVTLSANFDGVGSLRTIDAATLLLRARKLPSPLPVAEAQRLATELGARSVLTGTLIGEGERVRASVVLYPVGSDSALARATAVAAPREIAALTDSLTWAVLRQVWRHGTAPSPLLAGLTTASFDALRAFLDGERHFQRLDVNAALADYRRAFELDSNFAQAYLRYSAATNWYQLPEDSAAQARLVALEQRLPERERLWVETWNRPLGFHDRVAAWKALSLRFPDYPPFQMAAADAIIHRGPLYGIPLSDARPYLDRLDQLVPDHADTKFHQAYVASIIGTTTEAMNSFESSALTSGGEWEAMMKWNAELRRARATGQPLPPPEAAYATGRDLARMAAGDQTFAVFSGLLGIPGPELGYRLEALDQIRKAGIFTGDVEVASALGEGLMRVQRGDWTGGLRALRRAETSVLLPMTARLSSARLAAIGAWLGTVDAVTADSALRRVRQLPGADASPDDRAELHWLDGLLGVVSGDEARVRAATTALSSDTLRASRLASRSLAGLWMDRTKAPGTVDSLRSLSDDAMRNGQFLLSVEAVDRLVVARGLRGRGQPADAERYLMWTDAGVNTARNVSMRQAFQAILAYERGMAFDEAGNRVAAADQFGRFLEAYDQPPPAQRALVEEAKRRLRLDAGDAPVPPTPAP